MINDLCFVSLIFSGILNYLMTAFMEDKFIFDFPKNK